MQFRVERGTNTSMSHLRVLFCPCVVRKATSNVGTKALNMLNQAQNCFGGIFVGFLKHQKRYLVYVLYTRKTISSYDVIFYDRFSSTLAYKSQPYS